MGVLVAVAYSLPFKDNEGGKEKQKLRLYTDVGPR